jgi:hypothetical protein
MVNNLWLFATRFLVVRVASVIFGRTRTNGANQVRAEANLPRPTLPAIADRHALRMAIQARSGYGGGAAGPARSRGRPLESAVRKS